MNRQSDPPKLRFHEKEVLLYAVALVELLGSGSAMGHNDKLEVESVGAPWKPRDMTNSRRLPPSQSKAFAAARRSLEDRGLIVALRAGVSEARVTHFRLTTEGLDRATELTAGGADLAAIAVGFRRCEWHGAAELARRAEELADKSN